MQPTSAGRAPARRAPLPDLAPHRLHHAYRRKAGADGSLAAYKLVDPSFHNWLGLAMALRGNQISDFPLCNKSFNLSYAGHDL